MTNGNGWRHRAERIVLSIGSGERPYAYSLQTGFFQNLSKGVWLPAFSGLENQTVRTLLETPDGTVFVGCDNGIFKSADYGKTWKHVFEEGIVLNMVASDGVLLAGGQRGILRSTDGGEHWDWVLSEGGVGISDLPPLIPRKKIIQRQLLVHQSEAVFVF